MFNAKQAPRSRALLLAGVALVVVAGCAVFGWYYWQLISGGSAVMAPGLVLQVPQAPQPEVAASIPPAQAVEPVAAKPATPQGESDSLQANPTLPSGSHTLGHTTPHDLQVIADRSPLGQTPRGQGASARDEKSAKAESPPANAPAPKDSAIRIRQSTATNQVNPLLGKAYQSFIAGDIETSQQQYHKMLQQEPNNRDALLGMAAIALSRKQTGQSAAYYGKLLELDPADPDALAGLISLQGQTDPVQSESRLKKILAQNPQANAVHFALGNLYSQQSRWAEAQQAFFRAYSSAPGNADYAYNLAVSLDHLNQGKPALDYYQRALALGQSGPANFDKASVHNRVKELQPAASN